MIALQPADLAGFVAVFTRAAAFLVAAPLTGDRSLPSKVRVAAAVVIAFAVAPVRGPLDPARLGVVVPTDVLLGLAAGFTGRIVLAGIEAGGDLLGLQLGLGFAAAYDPSLGEAALPTRRIAVILAGLAFISAGGLEAGVRVVAGPPVEGLGLLAAARGILHESGGIMIVGLRFAAPLIISSTVANLAMALMSRAAPALNVFSVMLALVTVLGGAVLYATAPALVRETLGAGHRATDAILQAGTP